MKHSHLTFYNHGAQRNNGNSSSNKGDSSVYAYKMGGTGVVPGLVAPSVANSSSKGATSHDDQAATEDNADAMEEGNVSVTAAASLAAAEEAAAKRKKVNLQKQFEIIEYIKSVQGDSRVTYVDIRKDLSIDLEHDIYLLSMLKSNPRIDQERTSDGKLSFRYRTKYNIRSKEQLVEAIGRARTGLIMTDIVQDVVDFYPNVEAECNSLIVGGEIIAHHNRVSHSLILYPRGIKFLTKMSATVTAIPGEQSIQTHSSLLDEVRRGEGIKVGEHWYRVSSAVGTGSASDQTSTAKAPPTVTLDRDLPTKNSYAIPYTDSSLPLDGDFQGKLVKDELGNEKYETFVGPVYRHGVTTDIKEYWKRSASGIRAFKGDEVGVRQELVRLGLVSEHLQRREVQPNKKQKTGPTKRVQRRKTKYEKEGTFGVNAHVWGTDLEKVLKETAAKNMAEERLR